MEITAHEYRINISYGKGAGNVVDELVEWLRKIHTDCLPNIICGHLHIDI